MDESDRFEFDAFFSYGIRDEEIATSIADEIEHSGAKVWRDSRTRRQRKDHAEIAEYALQRSRMFIQVISNGLSESEIEYFNSHRTRFEDPTNKDRYLVLIDIDQKSSLSSLANGIYLPLEPERTASKVLSIIRQERGKSGILNQSPVSSINLKYKNANIRAYSFDESRSIVASGGFDNLIRISNIKNGRTIKTLKGHKKAIWDVVFSSNNRYIVSNSWDRTTRIWEFESGRCVHVFKHKQSPHAVAWNHDLTRIAVGVHKESTGIWDVATGKRIGSLTNPRTHAESLAWHQDSQQIMSGNYDGTCSLWDLTTENCIRTFEGHSGRVLSLSLSGGADRAFTGSDDDTCRLWDVETGKCLRVFEGHTGYIWSVTLSRDGRFGLSAAFDGTIRVWNAESGECLRVLQGHNNFVRQVTIDDDCGKAYSGDDYGTVCAWDLKDIVKSQNSENEEPPSNEIDRGQIQYTNAKVLLVGDSSSGKTGLTYRLATGRWKSSDASTVGAWATQWKLSSAESDHRVDREVWLWDFGGQSDQRLIHQLFMDKSSLILLLFDADREDVLTSLRDWQVALRRSVSVGTPGFLVAARIDTGFRASRSKVMNFARDSEFKYFETSALDGTGCDELRVGILESIGWGKIPITTTVQLFKLMKDEILKLRDEGYVVLTFKELRDILWRRLPTSVILTDGELQTAIGHLEAPGVVKELGYGSYILLAPEWLNAYAQAVIRTLRSDERELGRIPLRSIAEGDLIYHRVAIDGSVSEMKRLNQPDERVVLSEMERQLRERNLCIQQGDKLVFPSHCGRDKPAVSKHPSILVSYEVEGYLDDIYSTLVVKLADSEAFHLKDLWRDAADFDTLGDKRRMGLKLSRDSASSGTLGVYFGAGVTQEQKVIFANYIHAHLVKEAQHVQRLRYYVCPKCQTPKGNPHVLMDKLLRLKELADTECDNCGDRFPLWDALERQFASEAVRRQVEGLQAEDDKRLDARRKGKLLALEVAARITSADQKCFEIPGSEDEGLDMEVEFTDSDGRGTGRRLYLQLKAGNSHLYRRRDGTEIFRIKKQSWVRYWMGQGGPVLLVVGTFHRDGDVSRFGEGPHFAEIRWMEISETLRVQSNNGEKPVKQIVFEGNRLDALSVRRWRDQLVGA